VNRWPARDGIPRDSREKGWHFTMCNVADTDACIDLASCDDWPTLRLSAALRRYDTASWEHRRIICRSVARGGIEESLELDRRGCHMRRRCAPGGILLVRLKSDNSPTRDPGLSHAPTVRPWRHPACSFEVRHFSNTDWGVRVLGNAR
jgi:hypothetical protein